jgi:hypothetical protein
MQTFAACIALQDFAKLPWEVDMPADKAAAVLGSYLGVPDLEPAAVLDLDIDQITGARRNSLLFALIQHEKQLVLRLLG